MQLAAKFLVFCSLFLASNAFAYDPKEVSLKADETPEELKSVGIEEQLGKSIDGNLMFTTDKGEKKKFSQIIPKDKPFILSPIYYSCPNLCNLHMNGVVSALKELKWTVGKEFEVIAVSFDARETHQVAAAKKANYVEEYGRDSDKDGWHFLTADQKTIDQITKQVGFSFKWSDEMGEWAHSSAAIMITPEGKISRYLHGVYFPRQDMRLALIEASQGKVGDIIDSIVLYCFKFNPTKNKYTIYAYNLMKAGGTVMILLLGIFLVPAWVRERRSVRDNKS